MADVRLGIDAQGAVEGTAQFEQQIERLLAVLGPASESVDRFERSLARVGQGQSQSSALPESLERAAQATQALGTAQQGLTQAQQQGSTVTDELSRKLADLDRDVQTHVRNVDSITASSAEWTRSQEKQISVGLTLLSTLGGSERAFSQLTRAQLRQAEALGETVDRSAVLASVQDRVRQSTERQAVVFSTAAVNARDLRQNMANLANSAQGLAQNLATGTGGLLGNLGQIRNVMREIRLELGDLRIFGGGGGGVGGAIAGGSGLDRFGSDAAGADGGITLVSGSLARLIPVAAAATAGLALVGTAGLGIIAREGAKAEVELAKINGVIAATGNAAGITGERVARMVSDIVQETGRAGAEINATAAQLLTFYSISGDSFERALKLSVDLGVIFGSTSAAASSLGKALEDPIGGLGALARTGTKFTEGQKEQIRVLVESGRLHEAQGIIFEALEKQAAGVGEMVGNTLVGAWGKLKGSMSDALATANEWIGVTPALTSAINSVNDALRDVTAAAFPDPQTVLAGIDAQITEAEARLSRLQGAGFGNDPLAIASPDKLAARQLEALKRERAEAFAEFEAQLRGAFEADSAGRNSQIRQAADAESERLDKLGEKFKTTAARAEEYKRTVLEIRELSKAGVGDAEQAKLIEAAGKRIFGQAEGLQREAKAATASRDARKSLAAEIDREREARERVQSNIEQEIEDRERGIEILERELEAVRQGPDAVRALSIELEIEEAVRRRRNEAAAAGLEIDQQAIDQIDTQIREQNRLTDAIAAENKARADADRKAEQQAEQRQRALEEPFLEAQRNIQNAFAEMFEQIQEDGEISFSDLARSILDTFSDAFRQQLGAILTNVITGSLGTGGVGGALGGILGALGIGGQAAPQQPSVSTSTTTIIHGPPAPGDPSSPVFQGPPDPNQQTGSIGSIGGLSGLFGGAGGVAVLAAGVISEAISGIIDAFGSSETQKKVSTTGKIIGSILGATALGDLLIAAIFPSGDSKPQLKLRTIADASNPPADGRFTGPTVNSPFGVIGFDPNRTTNSKAPVNSTLSFVRQFDKSIATFLDEDEIAKVATALQSTSDTFHISSFKNAAGRELAPVIFDRLNVLMNQVLPEGLGETIEELATDLALPLDFLGSVKGHSLQDINRASASVLSIALRNTGGVIGDTSATDIASASTQFFEQRTNVIDALDLILERIDTSEAAQNLRELDDQFREIRDSAELLLIPLEDVTAAFEKAQAELRTNFLEDIGDQILAIKDPFTLALVQQERAYEAMLANAQAFGAGIAAVEFLNKIQIEELEKQFAEAGPSGFIQSIKDQLLGIEDPAALARLEQTRATTALLEQALAFGLGSADIGQILQLHELRLAAIVEQFAEEANALADPFGDLISQLTERPGAPLPAQDLLANIESRVDSLVQGANAGDAGALADLPGALADLVNQAQVVFGAGGQFGEIFGNVIAIAEQFRVQPEGSARSLTVNAPPIVDAIDNGTAENAALMAEQTEVLRQMAAQIEALQFQMLQQSAMPTQPARIS